MATVNIFNMADTWNNVATTYTAIKMNVTDTVSASGSLLMDLQVGGASAFNVSKGGSVKLGINSSGTNVAGTNVTISGSQGTGTGAGGSIIFQVAPAGSSGTAQNALADALTINSSRQLVFPDATSPSTLIQFQYANYGIGSNSNGETVININGAKRTVLGNNITFWNGAALRWSSTSSADGTADVILARDAANTLALRNSTNAQELRVYKTATGTVYKALLGDNNLIKIAGEAFADGAGANTGTLTNSPVIGNPTKWISIDDNGTTRYIPAW